MFLHVQLAALLMFNSSEKLVFLACRGVTQSDIVENERMLPPLGLSRWNLHEINSNRVEALKQFTSRLWMTLCYRRPNKSAPCVHVHENYLIKMILHQ